MLLGFIEHCIMFACGAGWEPRLSSLSITHKYEFRGFGEEFGLLSDPKRGQSLLLAGREDRRFKGILVNV